MKRTLRLGLALLFVFVSGISQVQATVIYDAASDFSPTSNPNGVWTYGYYSAGVFTPYTLAFSHTSGLAGWGATSGLGGNPSVFNNPTGSPITVSTLTLNAGELAMHPGPAGEISVVMFTAPTAALYSVGGYFKTNDSVGPTQDNQRSVYINDDLEDSQYLLKVPSSVFPISDFVYLSQGDTIGFGVGAQTYGYNTTGFNVTFEAVPEPSVISFLGLSLLVLGFKRRRQLRL
jgi:hypothetical protein|tara:strand:+ start:180 stop:875 length:696 start_codon:yes stop_codon:yes gene_type:complete